MDELTYHSLVELYGQETAEGMQALQERRRASGVVDIPFALHNAGGQDKETVELLRDLPAELPEKAAETPQVVDYVKIWPALGLASIKSKLTGAWRLWRVGHHLDKKGSGRVLAVVLESYLVRKLGVPGPTFRRWRKQAVNAGLVAFRDDGYCYLVGSHRAAVIVGCKNVRNPALVPAEALVTNGWRSHIWAGYLATFPERPKSRLTLERLSGIEPETQRRLERQAGGLVEKQRNYSTEFIPKGSEPGDRLHKRPGTFIRLRRGKPPMLCEQLPNTYTSRYQRAGGWRSKIMQEHVNAFLGSANLETGQGPDWPIKIYFEQQYQASKAAGSYSDQDIDLFETYFRLGKPKPMHKAAFHGRCRVWHF